MSNPRTNIFAALAVVVVLASVALPAAAKDGRVRIWTTVTQAHIFIDGRSLGPLVWQGRAYKLSAGEHELGIYNYGYKPHVEKFSVTDGQDTKLRTTLEPVGGPVSGPFGRIQIESGHGRYGPAAVLLNGKTPDYLVGHSDMFNHDWIWKQELLVPPGTHTLTIVREGETLWSGEVTVAANQRVIVKPGDNSQRTTDWPRGQKLSSVPRFKAGIASATVAVAPVVVSNFSATPSQINCLDSSRIAWSTSEAVDVTLQGSEVAVSGEQLVSPRANTTYTLVATGPGGRQERSAAVSVNSGINASIGVAPNEIRYRKIGDRVVEHGTATVTWSTTNADAVNIDPLGSVSATGNRSVQPAPRQTAVGPVSESVNYALTATNPCGGRETRSAALRITGSIEPLPEVVLLSVFFPTDYPDERNPSLGLLGSQRRGLTQLADGLKKYLEYDRNARLRLEAHADERASVQYNSALSGRRATIVKQFLVDQGIPSANIESTTFGEEQNLAQAAVQELENQNPAKAPRQRLQNRRGDWLAHNRRVDVVLQPSGQRSVRYYPHNADDSGILWQVPKPSKSTVEKNQ